VDLEEWDRQLAWLELESARPPAEPSPVPDAFPRRGDGPRLAVLGVLAEDAIGAFDAAMAAAERAQAEPPRGAGSNRERTVALMLSPDGRVTCRADARWVHGQTGPALSDALGQALAAARQTLARASRSHEAAQLSARTDQLMQEILAELGGMAGPDET
jgi:hypothetical protein